MGESAKDKGGWRTNKWVRAAIPALLLHCSIGTVYCWSIFSQEIADYIGFTKGATEVLFFCNIFVDFYLFNLYYRDRLDYGSQVG